MKFSKSLLWAFAGLGLFACSNEEVVTEGGNIQGDATVRVTVNTDLLGGVSRAISPTTPVTGSHGETANVEISKIVVKVTAGVVGTDKGEITFNSLADLEAAKNQVTFTGIRQPTKVEVFVNNGKSADWTLTDFYNSESGSNLGLKAPMYGYADPSHGLTQGEDGNYSATITPKHETALLEFSEIKHVDKNEGNCYFKAIKFDGLFLNNVKLNEGSETYLTGVTNWATAIAGAPTYSEVGESFKKADGQWPAAGQCYAYNIFPTSNMPILTLCFSEITTADNVVGFEDGVGYATVKSYKIENVQNLSEEQRTALGISETTGTATLTKFVEGYVYKFKSLNVADENIGEGIEGGEDVSLTATVDIVPWTIAEGTVQWN